MASVIARVTSRFCSGVRPANHWMVMFGTVVPPPPEIARAEIARGARPGAARPCLERFRRELYHTWARMKVTAVDSVVLRVPTPRPMALAFPEHRFIVCHVRTDEGLDGLGYTLAFGGGGAEAIEVYLATRLRPLVVGQDPLFVERLW